MPKVVRELTRLIKLTYTQSLQLSENDRDAEDFVQVGTNYSGLQAILPTVSKKPRLRNAIENILQTKFPYSPDPKKRRVSDTGWTIGDIFKEVLWDIVNYRVGVREVTFNSFQFAPVSSVVTVPARSPKPIYKVLLKTEETIPASFPSTKSWIDYHVTFDNGQSWHRINPQGKPTRFDENGQVVPRIITIGQDRISTDPETKTVEMENDPYEVRLKVTIRADTTIENSDKLSPVLHGYQLFIYPRGGLTGNTTGE